MDSSVVDTFTSILLKDEKQDYRREEWFGAKFLSGRVIVSTLPGRSDARIVSLPPMSGGEAIVICDKVVPKLCENAPEYPKAKIGILTRMTEPKPEDGKPILVAAIMGTEDRLDSAVTNKVVDVRRCFAKLLGCKDPCLHHFSRNWKTSFVLTIVCDIYISNSAPLLERAKTLDGMIEPEMRKTTERHVLIVDTNKDPDMDDICWIGSYPTKDGFAAIFLSGFDADPGTLPIMGKKLTCKFEITECKFGVKAVASRMQPK